MNDNKNGSVMLTRREVIVGFAGVPLFAPVAFAQSKDEAAEKYVKTITLEVMKLASSGLQPLPLRKKFSQLLGRYVNMRGVANYALGPNVRKLPAGQKDDFYGLVENYAAALFAWYAKDFRGNEFVVESSTRQGRFLTIDSAIKGPGNGPGGTQIKWRLTGEGGKYRVEDVNVKNVWMAIAMKKRFGDILNRSKGDFGPLFAELREADTWWN
jgi:ABC-type transporter MlaC component